MSNVFEPHIDAALEGGLDLFEEDVKRRYATDEDARAMWESADRIAGFIHDDAMNLAGKGEGLWSGFRELLTEKGLDQEVEYALQARLARHLLPSFAGVAGRCWDLAALVKRTNPPEQVRRFLARVTRCYLLEFVPECLVMCRGALENAVYARFAREGVPRPRDAAGHQTMRAALDDSARRGWLNGVSARRLHDEVWKRGSTAAHKDPNVVGRALQAIELTMSAMAALSPPGLLDDA